MVERGLRFALRSWRRVAGDNTYPERAVRRSYRFLKSRIERKVIGRSSITFWSGARRSHRVGIYAKGSCDLTSLFSCQPLIQRTLDGTCGILLEGAVWDSSTRLMLQGLQGLPDAVIQTVIDRLKLPPNYFSQSQLYEAAMTADGPGGVETFPKSAVILSLGPDFIRTLYRHREHGFFVDPGGWWFNAGMSNVLKDLSVATWFREQFESVGRTSVEDFASNFAVVVAHLRERSNAPVLVYNVLTIEPGSSTHNYQLVKHSMAKRAREFNLALVELSRKLDLSIVDVDRALKRAGVSGQVDYAHFPPELYPAVAREAFRVMKDLEVF